MIWLAQMIVAQACCGGVGALQPTRLLPTEDVLVAVQLHAQTVFASAPSTGEIVINPAGTGELDFEETVSVAVRPFVNGTLRHLQLQGALPIDETWRQTPGRSEAGLGVGDATLGARWSIFEPGERVNTPGIWVAAVLTAPTGIAPEYAAQPLATDATGRGAWRGALGLEVEHSFTHLLLYGALSGVLAASRNVYGLTAQDGAELDATLGAGYIWIDHATFAGSLTGMFSADGRFAGMPLPDSGRRDLRAALSAGTELSMDARLQASLFCDLYARDDIFAAGFAVTIIRRW